MMSVTIACALAGYCFGVLFQSVAVYRQIATNTFDKEQLVSTSLFMMFLFLFLMAVMADALQVI
jgi:phosphate/sulfate permease